MNLGLMESSLDAGDRLGTVRLKCLCRSRSSTAFPGDAPSAHNASTNLNLGAPVTPTPEEMTTR
jgi:hypothetical protein